ncbi:MAG: endonuclease/exonuclease/phosphatase family protein [Nocardioidaceae bacterium]|nr:endonuclease/exonuclease/phosphatase family protein [Nocardioidaceae bacterium]
MSRSAEAWQSRLSTWLRPDAVRQRPPVRPVEPVVRVLSWNIHHGADAWNHLDLEAVAERIASADADVVLLQEVDRCWGPRSDDVDQTQWLAERLEMHGTYGWTRSQPRRYGPAEGTSGNALLSRGSWTGVTVSRFAVGSVDEGRRAEPRGMVSATTQTPIGPARFCSTHLSTQRATHRSAQLAVLLGLVRPPAPRSGASRTNPPLVLGGDLGAEARDAELSLLSGSLVDAWRVAGRGLGDTTPATGPWRRVDQVWIGGLQPVNAAVLCAEASDHLPVLVDLAVPEPAEGAAAA